jgi:chemotaxis protein CheZ
MSEDGIRRSDLLEMVDELRAALRDIGDEPMPQAQLVTDTRERLRYIARLTEQAASQTLNAVEDIGDMLRTQQREADRLSGLTRSPKLHEFLERLQAEHSEAGKRLTEIVQAQAFQDLVGQVVNKLLDTVQRMEDSLAHLLVEAEADGGLLAGPQTNQSEQVSQEDVDSLFD